MSGELGIWISLVAAPAMGGLILYFLHDYKNSNDDRITRLEGIAMNANKTSKENKQTVELIRNEIEIVIRDDSRILISKELEMIRHEIDLLNDKDKYEMSDIKNHSYYIQRHEEALGKIHVMLKSHYSKITDIYMRLNNKSLT